MTWIIGDIHGCKNEVIEILKKIPSDDSLVFLGDYIDRGPDSSGVIDLLLTLVDRSQFILGNHESMLYSYFHEPDSAEAEAFLFNGGRETLYSYGLDEKASWEDLPEAHRRFYQNLLPYVEGEDFIAVHAGVNVDKGTDLAAQEIYDLIWIRHDWIQREMLWKGKTVYYGHTPVKRTVMKDEVIKPLFGKKSVCLDTGCVYGGYLSAMNPLTKELLQVRSTYGL